ncbi:MAG: hypothetical protein RLZZ453_940 [Chlamydiota bacterium]|jgi:hypothetical protein
MTDPVLPGDIEDPGRIFAPKPIGPGDQQKMPMSSQPFSSYMKAAKAPEAQSSQQISPLAMMQGSAPHVTTPNPDALLQQVGKLQATSLQLQNHLKTPQLKLKASTKYLLKNKFSEVNENLSAINAKMGAQPFKENPATIPGPLGKFLGYLTSGQQMLGATKEQLEKVKALGTHMSPGDFLLIQVKLNKAQQLLEFSSVLLSSAVSDIKQFMQIQL